MIHLHPHAQAQLELGASHLHRCGARTFAEILAELAFRTNSLSTVLDLLAEYRRISPAVVRLAGGDNFPPRPLLLVPR